MKVNINDCNIVNIKWRSNSSKYMFNRTFGSSDLLCNGGQIIVNNASMEALSSNNELIIEYGSAVSDIVTYGKGSFNCTSFEPRGACPNKQIIVNYTWYDNGIQSELFG